MKFSNDKIILILVISFLVIITIVYFYKVYNHKTESFFDFSADDALTNRFLYTDENGKLQSFALNAILESIDKRINDKTVNTNNSILATKIIVDENKAKINYHLPNNDDFYLGRGNNKKNITYKEIAALEGSRDFWIQRTTDAYKPEHGKWLGYDNSRSVMWLTDDEKTNSNPKFVSRLKFST